MQRLMRLRKNNLIRDLMASTEFNTSQLIQPLFAVQGQNQDVEVPGLKGVFRQGQEGLLRQIDSDLKNGVRHFILFCVPQTKSDSDFSMDFVQQSVEAIKSRFGNSLFLWVDHCLCSMTKSGHCGVLDHRGQFEMTVTHKALGKMALACASAGADGISPSDMMDGRVAYLRQTLDESGHDMIPIMSYSTKFSSHFYGPFRQAADSAPSFGDRKAYQIDVRNQQDAINASLRCAQEGADLLMVKPGISSIDLIRPIHQQTVLPVGAYQVSGEYAGMVLLAEKGLTSFDQALLETWHVFKRAGAQFIITYGARHGQRLGIPCR